MKVSRIVASALAGTAAAAAIAAPALAAEQDQTENALGSVAQDAGLILSSTASDAGLEWGTAEAGNAAGDFGSTYGDAMFHDKQSSLVASYGAPLVHVDARCVDAMGGIGGYGTGILGNSAKCNLDDVQQIDDSNGLIG
ncbi:hypothetical protein [Glycomyces salinus]|uniref:hypothetical protein n=1 Tax=Glycomyces salinus TaxID=980294 RepID=UPI0018EC7F32|nr:hypothetical protein [Glycomyces salinus]